MQRIKQKMFSWAYTSYYFIVFIVGLTFCILNIKILMGLQFIVAFVGFIKRWVNTFINFFKN
jgi:hypothetical protein